VIFKWPRRISVYRIIFILHFTSALTLPLSMPMPYQQADDNRAPAAEVRPADASHTTIERFKGTPIQSIPLGQVSFSPQLRNSTELIKEPECEARTGISNRPIGGKYRLIYINGIRTSAEDAQKSTALVKRSIGIDDCEVTLLYNPTENSCSTGLKLVGALASSRLGNKAEPQCFTQLKDCTREVMNCPQDRLIIVAHSQGTLITQNVFDRLYDEYSRSPAGEKLWQEQSSRIEIIMYAPLVRTIAPGPNAVSLLNSLDLPARSIGGLQRMVADSKHYTGWREQQAIQTVIYSPQRNRFPDVILNPSIVHDSFDLILDNVDFNFQLLGQNHKTHKLDPVIFASNLSKSILMGKRSDAIHHELIIKGCQVFGRSFAVPFLNTLSETNDAQSMCIDKFIIKDVRLERVQRAAGR
jgi:hypothetical protein